MTRSFAMRREESYWNETRQPLTSLAFVIPWLIAYEGGVCWLGGGDAFRNGADSWLRTGLSALGGTAWWILPVALVVVLLVWHLATGHDWRIRWNTLGGMLSESVLFAVLLILLGQSLERGQRLVLDLGQPLLGVAVRAIGFVGAGLYEEFLFRLCLIPLVYPLFRGLLLPRSWALGLTLVATSLVFSVAHYLGPVPDGQSLSLLTEAVARVQSHRELWFGFAFRTIAGLVFGTLFCLRGFGIAVGAHALYDIIVGVVLVTEL